MVDRSLVKSFLQSTAGEWMMILSLVFGGCCSNVWALEAVLKNHPNSGTFLTFAQFTYVTLQTLSSQFYFPPLITNDDGKNNKGANSKHTSLWGRIRIPKLRKREVPMKRWLVQVVLFLGVSLMNNYAFGLKIPVTVHIIFRSGGLCVSMLTGYLMAGKRYSTGQVLAGITITLGIILATLSAPRRRTPTPTPTTTSSTQSVTVSTDYLSDNMQYAAGIGILSLALFMSAWLGLWQEQTYKVYGKRWREALFYCHFLSLPFFIPLYPSLQETYTSYASSAPLTLLRIPQPSIQLFTQLYTHPKLDYPVTVGWMLENLIKWREIIVPSALFALAVNVITQGLCIRGVNRLTSRVNSTTVNLVLTVRKAVSLAISVWYYGSKVSWGLVVGGAMVLGGTVLYSMAPGPKVIDQNKKIDSSTTVSDSREAASSALEGRRPISQSGEGMRNRISTANGEGGIS